MPAQNAFWNSYPLEAVVAQIATLAAGELLALVRHLRPRLVPSEEPPAPAVAERLVQMDAAELRELGRRLCASGWPRRPETTRQGGRPGRRAKTLRVDFCPSARRQRPDTLISIS